MLTISTEIVGDMVIAGVAADLQVLLMLVLQVGVMATAILSTTSITVTTITTTTTLVVLV